MESQSQKKREKSKNIDNCSKKGRTKVKLNKTTRTNQNNRTEKQIKTIKIRNKSKEKFGSVQIDVVWLSEIFWFDFVDFDFWYFGTDFFMFLNFENRLSPITYVYNSRCLCRTTCRKHQTGSALPGPLVAGVNLAAQIEPRPSPATGHKARSCCQSVWLFSSLFWWFATLYPWWIPK